MFSSRDVLNSSAVVVKHQSFNNTGSVKDVYIKPQWDQLLCFKYTGGRFIHVKSTKLSYLGLYLKFNLYRIPFYSGFYISR